MKGVPSDAQVPPTRDPATNEKRRPSFPPPKLEGYDIIAPLGEGGMGTVWRAVQVSTRREVALKVLGKGVFGSEKARARFEREVELTARLQHPNIARIYDRGAHNGICYYAMELIEGVPLDRHIEEKSVSQREILGLMLAVCQAVQHAHERGIIHRDLKPSNILVTEDGQPHLLDFGVAKAFVEDDSDLSISTDGGPAGTPAYMSPEQAAGHLEHVDTRTDVYALGVILFQLLTGQSPHDLSGTRYEILRRVAEEEVKRPREVAREVDRELEALLLKALAHDPISRYPSAGALAQDMENYLIGEPLAARRPTTTYFLLKRIKKYRAPVAIASSFLAVLIGMAVLAYVRVAHERDKAVEARDKARRETDKANAVYEFLGDILASLEPAKAHGREITLRESLDQAAKDVGTKFANQPEVEAKVRARIGDIYLALGQYGDAETQYWSALEISRRLFGKEHKRTLTLTHILAVSLILGDKPREAEPLLRQCLEIRRRILGEEHPDTLAAMTDFATSIRGKGEVDEAKAMLEHLVETHRRVNGEEHVHTLTAMMMLSQILAQKGESEKAKAMATRCLDVQRRTLGEEHPDTLASMRVLGDVLSDAGKLEEAEQIFRQCLDIYPRVLGEEHPDTLSLMHNLASTLWGRDKRDEAEAMLGRTLEISRRVLGEEHPDTLLLVADLGAALRDSGKLDEAEAMHRRCLEIQRRVLGEEHRGTLLSLSELGEDLRANGKLDEAEAMVRQALEIRRRILGEEHPETLRSMSSLGATLRERGKLELAEETLSKCLRMQRRILGEEHRNTLWSMHELAIALACKGDFNEAEAMHRRLLEIRRRVLGEEHSDTLSSMTNLGLTLMKRGRLEEAEVMLRQAVDTLCRVRGREHPLTLIAMMNLAPTLAKQGKLDQAEALHSQAFEVRRRVLGEEHRETLGTMSDLGTTLFKEGKFDRAEAILSRCLEISRRVLGDKHQHTLMSMMNVATALNAKGETERARVHYETLCPLLAECVKERSDDVPTRAMLASVCEKLDKLDECEREWKAVMDLNPGFARAYNDLAYAWIKRDIKLEEAMKLVQKALDLQPENGAYIDTLGWGYFKQGKLDEALSELQRALKAGFHGAEVYDHLGDVFSTKKMTKQAIQHWQKALELSPGSSGIQEKIEKNRNSLPTEDHTEMR